MVTLWVTSGLLALFDANCCRKTSVMGTPGSSFASGRETRGVWALHAASANVYSRGTRRMNDRLTPLPGGSKHFLIAAAMWARQDHRRRTNRRTLIVYPAHDRRRPHPPSLRPLPATGPPP